MEFKRTAEGRVFFSGAKSASNDEDRLSARRETPLFKSPLTGNILSQDQEPDLLDTPIETPQSQYQVLALLKALNEKLKLTQIERNSMRQELKAYRQMIDALEQKSDVTEKAFTALRKQMQDLPEQSEVPEKILKDLEETRKLYERLENRTERSDKSLSSLLEKAEDHKQLSLSMSKKQADLERRQKLHETSMLKGMERVKDLSDRIENTEVRQDQMQGQIKTALDHEERFTALLEQDRDDRARFIRKLERLEETVLLLNTDLKERRALEDKNAAGQGKGLHIPHYLIGKGTSDDQHHHARFAWPEAWGEKLLQTWHKALNIPMPVALFGGLVLIILGWWISATQTQQSYEQFLPQADLQPSLSSAAPQSEQAGQWQVSDNVDAFAPPQAVNPNVSTAAQQDAMSSMIDGGQADQVAAMLNAIAPGEDQGPALNLPEGAAQTATPRNEPLIGEKISDRNAALPQDFQTLEALAIQGKADAQHDLAALYVVGKNGVKQDYERAAYWFEQAANGDVANAAYNMGVLYHQGLGVDADLEKAVKWYTKAAEQGHPEAAYNLGIAYIEGVGVDYDPFKATLHFEQAAAGGTVEAAYNLGLIYENGLLGSPKPGEALMWYKMAADRNLPEAQAALNQLVDSLGIGRGEIDKIVEDVKKSYPALNAAAQTPAKDARIIPISTGRAAAAADDSRVALIRNVQQELIDLDLYPGPVDGSIGPLTQDAVRSYQRAYDLPINGEITQALLDHMRR